MFESPYEWKVYEAENLSDNDNRLLFPYLFIQSGVKPIVEKRQIIEYYKMVKAFQSDKIVVLGYRINCDDNHINGLLRNAYECGSEIVYMDYPEQNGNHSNDTELAKRLRIDKPTDKLRTVPIESHNCFDLFEREITSQ